MHSPLHNVFQLFASLKLSLSQSFVLLVSQSQQIVQQFSAGEVMDQHVMMPYTCPIVLKLIGARVATQGIIKNYSINLQ